MSQQTLVSLILITYNQEQFVRESVQSALLQTYSPLEIILSDDCSGDRTFDIMKEEVSAYRGPHKVILSRNKHNLGLAGNLNSAYERSTGKFIVLQAGDDISVPDRVRKLVNRWQSKDTPVDLVCSYFEEIDINGKPTGFIKKEVAFVPDLRCNVTEWRCGATGACAAYSKKLFEKYGPLDNRVISEDWVYSFRAWLESGIAVVEEPLVKHRTHDASISVMHRNVQRVKNKKERRVQKRRASEGQLAIAEEWLRAWGKCTKPEKLPIENELRRLVILRELQFRSHGVARSKAFMYSIEFLLKGGRFIGMLKLMGRHVLRIN